ncbi:MAG TPA: hypothetical protein VMV59_11820 [Candidatus Dormibacteraeota bacterium]|nr:hypothetical protein [Candidatus Dormibacteraeota bacterium]
MAAGATVAAVTALILGFFVLGSPNEQRLARADNQRIAALAKLAGEVNSSWRNAKHALPSSLAAVSVSSPSDPITGAPYEYHSIGADQYELCATFSRDNRQDATQGQSRFWLHPKAHYCFTLRASQSVPEVYPQFLF